MVRRVIRTNFIMYIPMGGKEPHNDDFCLVHGYNIGYAIGDTVIYNHQGDPDSGTLATVIDIRPNKETWKGPNGRTVPCWVFVKWLNGKDWASGGWYPWEFKKVT